MTKDDWEKKRDRIDNLLDEQLSLEEMRELIPECNDLPVNVGEWDDFEEDVFLRMFWVFVKAGDRESLVKLFSTRFLPRYYFADTESILVRDGEERTKDPILILDEALAKCEIPEVRHNIAQAVRHAFVGSGIRGNDDADFVKNAFDWYKKEKDELVFSPEYLQNSYDMVKRYSRHPMFLKKGSATNEPPVKEELAPVKIELPKTTTNSIGMKLALIPAGEFVMGSRFVWDRNKDNEAPQHPVRFAKPFWMGVYEVTQEEYEKVMGKNPSFHSSDYVPDAHWRGIDFRGVNLKRLPVECVTWYDAAEFCNRLSKKEGLSAYYGLSARNDNPWRTVKILGGAGYRLPTEAEWEYACRAGTTTRYSFGNAINKTQANYEVSLGRPAEVGSYPANAFGLFDMHGNVEEWCNDAYDFGYYDDCPIDNPPGPLAEPNGNQNKTPELPQRDAVVRGGHFGDDEDKIRSACRHTEPPWGEEMALGFRVARSYPEDAENKH